MTTPNDLPSVGTALPAPFGFLCEWATHGGFPATQTVYYGGPGNGIDDDWNCHPEVHENLPIYTAEQMQAYACAAVQAAQAEAVGTAIPLTPAEIQSNHSRVNWAEGLIRQLPEDHDGRNSWLLNYGNAPRPKDYAAAPTEAKPAQQDAVDAEQVEAAAKVIAASIGHPWDRGPERERDDLRDLARDAIRAAISAKKGQP